MKPSIIVTVIFLLLVSLSHLLRLILQVKVTANTFELPMWASVPAFIVTLVLAIWFWLENKN